MKYIIGNWKAHMSLSEMQSWVNTFSNAVKSDSATLNKLVNHQATVIICPPFPLISLLKDLLSEFPNIHIGAQNIASVAEGAFTGEVPAKTLKGLVKYAIVGHSERRHFFHETDEDIQKKIELCYQNEIQPILCIRGQYDAIDPRVELIAYEPIEAIGTGNNQPVDEVLTVKQQLNISLPKRFIYGGSVNGNNAAEYIFKMEIDGILPGNASLNPHEFLSLIKLIP